MSGLANKTCTGTSKRYQLCKVQVRISFVSCGKSWLAFLGALERGHHLSCSWHPVALQAAGGSLLWCPPPVSGLWAFCHKIQRVALVTIPRGFLQWGEEEEEEEDVALAGEGDGNTPCSWW